MSPLRSRVFTTAWTAPGGGCWCIASGEWDWSSPAGAVGSGAGRSSCSRPRRFRVAWRPADHLSGTVPPQRGRWPQTPPIPPPSRVSALTAPRRRKSLLRTCTSVPERGRHSFDRNAAHINTTARAPWRARCRPPGSGRWRLMSTENSRVPALGAPHGREVTEFDASVDVLGLPAFAGSVGSAPSSPRLPGAARQPGRTVPGAGHDPAATSCMSSPKPVTTSYLTGSFRSWFSWAKSLRAHSILALSTPLSCIDESEPLVSATK